MTGRRLSKSEERKVVKTYALEQVKKEWKQEAEEEGLSLSRYLHNLIQEGRAMRKQGRLKLGDKRRVEELRQEVDELQNKLEKQGQTRSDPENAGSTLVQRQVLENLVPEDEYKTLDQILKQLVGNEEFQDRLRTELKTELYRLANTGRVEYRRGSGWKNLGGGE
ncbi:hypothetical protein Harman_29800 [Haloarcula mannanilytica]|uniref:Uncharacterized protein n=1 Tax=Haloarcula mannanilytica TaxID=2509225 RepID=A0A4C2EKW5_9EURY|nr:hypothetical protein [Haloarcula mannanilytica]GCF15045.1 hypothetical protein Harman_29800 [Haloarcula mannanilytica]